MDRTQFYAVNNQHPYPQSNHNQRQSRVVGHIGTPHSVANHTQLSSTHEPDLTPCQEKLLYARRILSIFITIPLCALFECVSGIAVGLIAGACKIARMYDSNGLLPTTLPLAIPGMAASLFFGFGLAIIGIFYGTYDGFKVGWNQDLSVLRNRVRVIERLLNEHQLSNYRPTNRLGGA